MYADNLDDYILEQLPPQDDPMNTTVQFRIDRGPGGEALPKDIEPFTVWVEWPAEQRHAYSCRCSEKIFRLTKESARELISRGASVWRGRKQLSNPDPAKIFVCPCMGEIIE